MVLFRDAARWGRPFIGFLFLFLTGLAAQAQPPESWTEAQLAAAHTAKDVSYLTEEEKQVIWLGNLARTDGALFARTYLKEYVAAKLGGKSSRYVTSLIRDLQRVKGLPLLKPHEALHRSAERRDDRSAG